ncbi:hypothetical protein AAVH_24157 [Aphelenchoides avenae]|nr:hypothetical protein AAVH_24157 [Aphelenchus avenae]
MLPNESLLQVLHFVDYKILVLTKLSGKRFLRLVTKFAEELAHRHLFAVYFYAAYIEFDDVSIRTLTRSIRYERRNQASLGDACRELDEAIGPHSVLKLVFSENTWNMPGIGVVFEAAPSLKYAEQVALFSPNGSTYNSNAFMSNFAGMKSLRLRFDYGIFRHFSWTFLGQECALELRLIQLIRPLIWSNDMNHSVEELVRCCATLPHLLGGQALELDFSGSYFSAAFALRIIGVSVSASVKKVPSPAVYFGALRDSDPHFAFSSSITLGVK